jgi:hypothetical protein
MEMQPRPTRRYTVLVVSLAASTCIVIGGLSLVAAALIP